MIRSDRAYRLTLVGAVLGGLALTILLARAHEARDRAAYARANAEGSVLRLQWANDERAAALARVAALEAEIAGLREKLRQPETHAREQEQDVTAVAIWLQQQGIWSVARTP